MPIRFIAIHRDVVQVTLNSQHGFRTNFYNAIDIIPMKFTPKRQALLLFAFLLLYSGRCFSQMRQVSLDGVAENEIYKTSFYSPSEGYVAFRDWVGYTADSGRTFGRKYITLANVDYSGYSVNLTFGFAINGVKAFDRNTLVTYGHYGRVPAILYSANGGSSFKLVFHSQFSLIPDGGIEDMIFPENGSIGYAADANRILKTSDRGLSWSVVHSDPSSYFNALTAANDNIIVALSTGYTSGKLLKTLNGGNSWHRVDLPALTNGKMTSASFISANTGWLSMYDDNNSGLLYKTTNGGINWSLHNNPLVTPVSCYKMKFLDNSIGYALSGQNTVIKTFDGGKIWEPLARDNDFAYLLYSHNDLQCLNADQIWAGGGHGLLEMSSNGGGSPLPRAYFQVDTAGSFNSGTVKLISYSRSIYTHKWFVNGTQISEAYSTTYGHVRTRIMDTVTLVVSNGIKSDTAVKYQAFIPPVGITSFFPDKGAQGTIITINGANFSGVTGVTFGGVAAGSFTVVSPDQIRATVGTGASGHVKISGLSGIDSLAGFVFIPSPVIASFVPAAAQAGSMVTLTGSNLAGVSAVSFGGTPASSFSVISNTAITAIVPSGNSGTVSITSPGGTASLPGYIALPSITSFTPDSGTIGTRLTITGTSLSGINSVTVGGVSAQSFKINSSTSITAVVASGGTGNVVVTKTGGTSSASPFIWKTSPEITSFSPASGPVGTEVRINGSFFSDIPANNIVYFGAVRAKVKSSTNNSLLVTVPAGATFQPITVTTNQLTAYSAQLFLVTFANGGTITANSFSRQTIDIGNIGPMDLTIGDIDNDGRSDLIVTKSGIFVKDSGVEIYRNTSDGAHVSFDKAVSLTNLDYKGTAVGDLDGDGKSDLCVITDAGIATFRNTSVPGSISFLPSMVVPTSVVLSSISITDLDGDGKPDIAVGSHFAGTASVFRNNSNPGDISFETEVISRVPAAGTILLIDLDADNRPEIVSQSLTEPNFCVLKNNCSKGEIAFGAAGTFNSFLSYSLASGDVDLDGKVDLISSHYNGSKLVVFRNISQSGVIDFALPEEISTSFSPLKIGVSDLDGDGKPDIAAAITDRELTIVRNTSTTGKISFETSLDYTAETIRWGQGIAIGDINNDGKNDVVVFAGSRQALAVYVNGVSAEPAITSFSPTVGVKGSTINIQGKNFTGVNSVSFGGVPAASFIVHSSTSITAVAGEGASGTVTVSSSLGTGTRSGFVFGLPPVINSLSPVRAVVGTSVSITGKNFSSDVTGNIVYFGGVRAVVTAASPGSITATVPVGARHDQVTVTTNNRTAFSSQIFSVTVPVVQSLSFVKELRLAGTGRGTLSDIDGDGKLDMVSVQSASEIGIARNTSIPGSISFAPVIRLSTGALPSGFVLNDLDGDGRLDIVAYNYESQSISVLRNTSTTGNLSFGAAQNYLTGPATTRPSGATISDLDGDGKPEIIVANYYTRNICVFKNESTSGNILLAQRVDYGVNGYPTDVIARDLDKDGKPELVIAVNGSNAVCMYPNLSSPGTIVFAKEIYQGPAAWPVMVDVVDLDGDDKTDLLLPNSRSNNISLLRNVSSSGNLLLDSAQDLAISSGTKNISVGDLDGDGKADIVNLDVYAGKLLSIYKNAGTPGSPSFVRHSEYQVGENALSSSVGDIDGDGLADIVVYSYENNTTFLRNTSGLVSSVQICENSGTSIHSNVTGNSFQWQQNAGNGFVNITDNANFKGTTSAVLQVINIPYGYNNYQYRCMADNSITSATYRISLLPQVVPLVTIQGNTVVNQGQSTQFTAVDHNGGTEPSFQWQDSTGTNGWKNINNATSRMLDYVPLVSGVKIRCLLTSNAGCLIQKTVLSNSMAIGLTTVTGINPIPAEVHNVQHFPNPVLSVLNITNLKISDRWKTLRITSLQGNQVLIEKDLMNQSSAQVDVSRLAGGMYVARIHGSRPGTVLYFRFLKF